MRSLCFACVLMFVTAPASAQLIVAHRGASHDAPENTLAAFKLAWEQGADAIETDMHLTRDGKIILIHDKDTKRVAGKDWKVAEKTFDELRTLDVGTWKDKRFAGERMPGLAEVLAIVPADKQFFIEIKCGPEILPALKADLAASKVRPQQLVIISFSAEVIAAAKMELPKIKACWLTSFKQDKQTQHWSPAADTVMATLKRTSADGLDTNAHDIIDAGFVAKLREAKMEFHCWTVDDPMVARRFVKLGVDSITTNRPGWLREQLKLAR